MKKMSLLVALMAVAMSASALPTNPFLWPKGQTKDVSASLPTMPFVWPRWLRDFLMEPNPTIMNN